MNYPCGVIRDLIPLYHDDVCSPESRGAVETHCARCVDCKKILDDLNGLPEPGENVLDAEPLRPIQRKWKREKKKSLWIGLGAAIFLALFFIGHAILTEWYCIPMGKDDMVVTGIYQTSDGLICISYDDLYDLNYYSTAVEVGKDGCGYISAYRPILAKKTNTPSRRGTAAVGFDPDSAFAWLNGETMVPVSKVYLGIKDDPERSILVWEKGMEVRKATAEEEAEYALQKDAMRPSEDS